MFTGLAKPAHRLEPKTHMKTGSRNGYTQDILIPSILASLIATPTAFADPSDKEELKREWERMKRQHEQEMRRLAQFMEHVDPAMLRGFLCPDETADEKSPQHLDQWALPRARYPLYDLRKRPFPSRRKVAKSHSALSRQPLN